MDDSRHKITIIDRSNDLERQLVEAWDHRELAFFLGWKDVISRYSDTTLGILWSLLQPISAVVTLSIVMGRIAKLPSDGVPYPLFVFAGTLCWQYFATVANNGTNGAMYSRKLISKVYCPRLVFPISVLIPPAIDLAISAIVFGIMLLIWHYPISPNIVWLPAFLLLELMMSFAICLWFMSLSITFHDLRQILPFLLQLLYISSPVFYSSTLVSPHLALAYSLNPMASIINGVRWCVLGSGAAPDWHTAISFVVVLALMISGTLFYCRMSRTFADVI